MARVGRGSRFAPAALLVGIGCAEGPVDVFLDFAEQTQTVVVAVEENGALRVSAYDAREGNAVLTDVDDPQTDVTIYVLQYRASLTQLDMTAGELAPIRDNLTPSQFLTPADRQDFRVVRGREAGEWSELESFPDIVAGFRFKRTTAADCLVQGGCYVGQVTAGGEAPLCVTPCPEPTAPAPPEPPEPPRMVCPDGWETGAARGPDDVAVCEPYGGTRVADTCGAGEQHLPGTPGCRRMGRVCPAGDFGDVPAGAHYVRVGATNGNGSAANPFGTIAEALAAASDGDVIALARGRFTERVTLNRPITLVGACVEDTIIDGTVTTLTVTSTGVYLEDLSVEGTRGVEVSSGVLHLDAVAFSPRTSYALSVTGGDVRGEGVHFEGTSFGMFVSSGAVDLVDVTATDMNGTVATVNGGRVAITSFLFDTIASFGLSARGGETRLSRGMIREHAFAAVSASSGARVDLEDVVIRESVGNGASAVYASSEAEVVGTRVLIERAQGSAVASSNAHAELIDSVVRETRSQEATGYFGHGADTVDGGTLRFERTVFWEMRGSGIFAIGEGAHIELVDVVVAEVRGWQFDGDLGVALRAVEGGTITVERVRVPRAHSFGVVASKQSAVTGTDLHVLDTLPRDLNGAYGRGAEIEDGSKLHITRGIFEDGHSVAVYGLDPGTDIQLYDVRLSGSSESACVLFSCNVGLADGISIILSARAHVERFEIVDNDQYGVRISNEPLLTLADGLIARNATGIQSVSPNFAIDQIADRVRVVDNAEPLDLVGP
jgi:hypothetical protein